MATKPSPELWDQFLQMHMEPEQYREHLAVQRVTDDHGARIAALEKDMTGVRAQLESMSKEAASTRAETTTLLKNVSTAVEDIRLAQAREAGRKEGANARAEWFRVAIPFVLAGLLYLATAWVQDVVQGVPH